MGSYCSLYIKGLDVYAIKNRVNKNHLALFSPNEIVDTNINEDGEERRSIILRTTALKAKKRLHILGYNLERAIDYFNKGIAYEKEKCLDFYERNEEIDYFHDITFEKYTSSLRNIFDNNVDVFDKALYDLYPDLISNKYSKHILEKLKTGYYLSHTIYDDIWEDEEEFIDEIIDICICLHCVNDDDSVELDLSDVVESGWIDLSKVFDFYENEISKTVIITEGKTDIDVLERSIEFLFLDYSHLFTFFDFKTYRADGGASYLVKLLKSFSAAKISNKIIAIFDNDSAAINELQQLENMELLDTIKILKLPELDFCNNYPTLGPAGLSYLNVNGLAVGIEMFFGEDIIKEDGEYYPVIWNGYISRISKYQGVIDNKDKINKRMKDKLRNIDAEHDWEPLKKLWEHIFNA